MAIPGGNIVNYTDSRVVCRPATWIDICTFFVLNFGIHAITTPLPPGVGLYRAFFITAGAFFAPYLVIFQSLWKIIRCARWKKTELEQALQSQALCLVVEVAEKNITVPSGLRGRSHSNVMLESFKSGARGFTDAEAQGQYPEPHVSGNVTDGYALLVVPSDFKVYPLRETTPARKISDTRIAANYNLLKSMASIAQIVFTSKELYDSRGRQIEEYGYASYSLIVFPYLWMTFINLICTICERQYPKAQLVLYGGKERPEGGINLEDRDKYDRELEKSMSGYVGIVYGDFSEQPHKKPKTRYFNYSLLIISTILSLIAPYVLVYVLTHFGSGTKSTRRQRASMIAWFIFSQLAAFIIHHGNMASFWMARREARRNAFDGMVLIVWLGFTIILGLCTMAATCFGMVTATQTMMEFGICKKV